MELQKIDPSVQAIQDYMVENNHVDGIFGDGKSIANSPDVAIKHSFADQVYIRQMNLKKDYVIVGAIHNHLHAWFLLSGKVIINNNGEKIEHVAPCYTVSKPGSKRLIYAVEDSVFVNIHKNPSNTKNIEELEKEIVSMTMEEYNNKTI
jgi:quercetin dioxygenase-like cupin family protein|tara:strand:- start:2410 stop:2856 length:447 start_codon:yes stop_codon:yes gene_type:complete